MKNLSTKEFACVCANAVMSTRGGKKTYKLRVRDNEIPTLDDIEDEFSGFGCENDSDLWNECIRRFGTVSSDEHMKIVKHQPLENANEFVAAFFEKVKEIINQ